MHKSKRAKRMEVRHKRHKAAGTLNLVSLMDIFTILVFFLLVNSSDVEVLPNAKDIQLPESIAEQKAKGISCHYYWRGKHYRPGHTDCESQ